MGDVLEAGRLDGCWTGGWWAGEAVEASLRLAGCLPPNNLRTFISTKRVKPRAAVDLAPAGRGGRPGPLGGGCRGRGRRLLQWWVGWAGAEGGGRVKTGLVAFPAEGTGAGVTWSEPSATLTGSIWAAAVAQETWGLVG